MPHHAEAPALPTAVADFFSRRGWTPFDFQRECWSAYLDGASGLVHAPTGVGKTLSVCLGPMIEALHTEALREPHRAAPANPSARRRALARQAAEPFRLLWLTPMRALAGDTTASLLEPCRELGLNWTIEQRTGDTPATLKKKQRERLPTALVTTPESLSLLLSFPETREAMRSLRCVVVDEWHELIGTKRGVQTELALARLRAWSADHPYPLRTWGLSATLGNTEQAARVLLGPAAVAPRIVRGIVPKAVQVDTIRPANIDRFPWSGHMGLKSLDQVLDAIERTFADGGGSTLLFTNTRAQAEIWFGAIFRARPDWLGTVAIHHGSLDKKLRSKVEDLLKTGGAARAGPGLRCVVCTSSLDLGVDFSPVAQVIQVGSPKGIARLIQRAGRSGHRPGVASRILGVPTNAMELVEFSAAREAVAAARVESRIPVARAMDVLVQHLVTIAAGGGFLEADLAREVRDTAAFADLSDGQWTWAMDFVRGGGAALHAYPEYARIAPERGLGPRLAVAGDRIARRHRLNIGTIVGEQSMLVKFRSGRTLGTIEESFITRLQVGDRFVFAGRVLELLRVREMTAYATPARSRGGAVPRWNGGRMPLSTQLAEGVRRRLDEARRGEYTDDDMLAVRPVLELQSRWSVIPGPDDVLIEDITTRDGRHWFIFPFEGRLVHEGLGALLSYRLTRLRPRSVSAVCTDYGIELLSPDGEDLGEAQWRDILTTDGMLDDLLACLNSTELARRQFREIARIAGLVNQGMPGSPRPSRQLQASSEMFFEVLSEFDPANLLLDQARREVLESQLEIRRLCETLERIARQRLVIVHPRDLTPFSFPLWAESLRATHVTSESWTARIAKMALRLEEQAAATRGDARPMIGPKSPRKRPARPKGGRRAVPSRR
ncbi:MAG: ligase-associated DNA damage response DEXH box helicase [Phycisphaeraceae bacterium]|nr:ligase-associated DNA damage response DEXH box helicase [Phycisphaeraceae bacterium]